MFSSALGIVSSSGLELINKFFQLGVKKLLESLDVLVLFTCAANQQFFQPGKSF